MLPGAPTLPQPHYFVEIGGCGFIDFAATEIIIAYALAKYGWLLCITDALCEAGGIDYLF